MPRLHWQCDCGTEHVHPVAVLRDVHWAQCPRSGDWYRLEDHQPVSAP